jgi:hypothetical protein
MVLDSEYIFEMPFVTPGSDHHVYSEPVENSSAATK